MKNWAYFLTPNISILLLILCPERPDDTFTGDGGLLIQNPPLNSTHLSDSSSAKAVGQCNEMAGSGYQTGHQRLGTRSHHSSHPGL